MCLAIAATVNQQMMSLQSFERDLKTLKKVLKRYVFGKTRLSQVVLQVAKEVTSLNTIVVVENLVPVVS